VVFFKSGPLAWNGLLTWWIPLSVYGAWLVVMAWLLLRAINRDTADTNSAASAVSEPIAAPSQ
jgi:hypothetical protein